MKEFLDSERVFKKFDKIRIEKGFSYYALTKKAGVSYAAIYKWKNKKTMPSLYLLESLCDILGVHFINLFIEEDELVYLPKEQQELIERWNTLSTDEKNAFVTLLNSIQKK